MAKIADIRRKLSAELAKDSPNFALIASYSDQLADADNSKMRFSVEASHINRLGLELVAKRETALSELIKNAYDADATSVQVELKDYEDVGGSMKIIDDGSGMSRDVIKSAWMTLSTSSKADSSESPLFRRPRAGRKGIGRFATQRLGETLTLETGVRGESVGHRVRFDWDTEFVQGKKLSDIWTEIEQIPKDPDAHGTTLFIGSLRDKWTEASLKTVWKSILFLQPPFPVRKTSRTPVRNNQDPGFKVGLNGSSSEGESLSVSIEENLLQYALARIEGKIDGRGIATFSFKSDVLDTQEEFTSDTKFLLTGKVALEARYFIFDSGAVPGISRAAAKQLGDDYGGIRIHRNSFRVLPYGEGSNDWLNLDRDAGRRFILPPFNNANFFGYVSISGEENPLLEETSSREGLVENDAFNELTDFARQCLEWAVLRIAAARTRKQKATTKQDQAPEPPRPSNAIEDSFDELEDTLSDLDSSFTSDEAKERFRGALDHVRKTASEAAIKFELKAEQERARNIEYENMLRILASLGLSISVFGHEIKSATSLTSGTLSLLDVRLSKIDDTQLQTDLQEAVDSLRSAVGRVFDLGGYIEDLTSFTGTRKLKPVPVRGSIERFTKQFSSYLDKYGVSFDIEVVPKSLRTCPMHTSEFDSVLFNLLTNSIKAFQKASTKQPAIRIHATKSDDMIVLRFEDNGHAIAKQDRDKIFDAFYTTTEFSKDEVSGPGTGLGLTIVSDISSNYGGTARLVDAKKPFVTAFEVTLRAMEQGE